MKAFDAVRHEIVDFYDFDEDPREMIIHKVVAILKSGDKDELVREIREDFLQNPDSGIGVIYESITHDVDRWSDFIVEEYKRAFEAAKTAPEPAEILESLAEFIFVKNKNADFVRSIVHLLEKNFTAHDPAIRRAALLLTGDWITLENKAAYLATVAKIQAKLQDENWKVRYMAELTLTGINALPPGFSRRLMDKIKVYFGKPFK